MPPPRPPAPPQDGVAAASQNDKQAFIDRILVRVRAAPDGEKHRSLRDNARLLGGIQAEAGFCDAEGIAWLLEALPPADNTFQAEQTAAWLGVKGLMLVALQPSRHQAFQFAGDMWHVHSLKNPMSIHTARDASIAPSAVQPPAPGRVWLRSDILLGVLSVTAMLTGWWLIAAAEIVRGDLLPSPADVWNAATEVVTQGYRGTTLWENVRATLGRLLSGFLAATLTGVPLGLWMGSNRTANAALNWIIQFMRPLPPLSYMILLILWFGTGDLSKSMLLFLTAFPIVVASSAAGVRGVKLQRIQAAQALGAKPGAVFGHVILPSAAPMILTGLQIALAAAFSTVVSAELLAATNGLGWMVISASTFLRNDIIILCIIILGLLGVTLAGLLRAVDKWAIHWRGRD